MRLIFTLGLCTVAALPATAQTTTRTGTIVGTVARDSVGTMVGQAQVQLPQLNLSATTNWLGGFQFSNVPAGRYAITIKAIGFLPIADSLDVKPGARVDADIVLTAAPVDLAAQHTTASAVEKRLPPGLQEMNDRMKTHMGGYFVTDSVLRANNEKKMLDFIASMPAITEVLSETGSGVFLANGREQGDGSPIFLGGHLKTDGTFPPGKCYVNIFVDGAPYFLGPATPNNPPPDFGVLRAHDYSGIEYYPSGGTTPPEFDGTKSSCGLLLLWTRRTP